MFSNPVKINHNYLATRIERATITSLNYEAGDLLIFIDDTGVKKPSVSHPVFGLGGCALLGADYDVLKPEWMTLRRNVFQLADDAKFHATDILPGLSVEQLSVVTEFLRGTRPYKIANVVTLQSLIHEEGRALSTVIQGIEEAVDRLFWDAPAQHARWIFEHSDWLCQEMVTTGSFPNYRWPTNPDARQVTSPHNYLGFMRKKTREVGIEVADLIIFIVGKHYRDQVYRRLTYHDQITAMFSNERVGICENRISLLQSPIWFDAEGEIPPPPAFEIRISGPRRAARDGKTIGSVRITPISGRERKGR